MACRGIQPSTVRAFWDQVRLVGSPYDAAAAVACQVGLAGSGSPKLAG